jgi:hypothetical protein
MEGFAEARLAEFEPLLRFHDRPASIDGAEGRRTNHRRHGRVTPVASGNVARGPLTIESRPGILERPVRVL